MDRADKEKTDTKNGQGAGTVRWRRGKADVRLSLGSLGRRTFALPTCKTERQAEERRAVLAELASKLTAAGRVELGLPFVEQAASAEGTDLADLVCAVDGLCKGQIVKKPTGEMTFRDVAEKWLKGELTAQFKDYVKPRKDADAHLAQLNRYVLKVIGHLPMNRFTLEHGQEAMRILPAHYSAGTRRCVALLIHRIVGLAVFPLRLLPYNPLPKGFVPPKPPRKAMAHLYPDEEAQLLACCTVPLCDRVLYGFLNREGMRADEAFGTEQADLDLKRGAVALDKNKTNDPRAWALSPDVTRALRVWEKLKEQGGEGLFHRASDRKREPPDRNLVFYRRSDLAARLRDDLKEAGIKREVLFEHNATRQRLRAHDLRATFVTIGLANGRTERWIMDRTGHRSSTMVNTYSRAARTFAELSLGTLRPMDEAIPEIAEFIAAENAGKRGEADATRATPGAAKPSTREHATKDTASDGTKGHVPRSAPRRAKGRDAADGGAPELEAAANGTRTSRNEKASKAGGGDVGSGRSGWSLAGPSVPEGSRGTGAPSKMSGKGSMSRLLATPAPISK